MYKGNEDTCKVVFSFEFIYIKNEKWILLQMIYFIFGTKYAAIS